MKNNLALCFSGQLRCHVKLIVFWKEYFLKPLSNLGIKTMIFFHTSDEYSDDTIKTINKMYGEFNCVIKKEKDNNYELIKPKIFKLLPSGLTRGGHNQLLREFNHMDSVIKMKKKYEDDNNFIFDYVVRVRPDVFPLDFFEIRSVKKENFFFISNHDHHGGVNARFTVSNSHISDYIYTILDDCENLHVPSKLFSGEQFWKYHLTNKKVNVEFLNYNLYLMRDYDTKFPVTEQGKIFLNGKTIFTFKNNDNITLKSFQKN